MSHTPALGTYNPLTGAATTRYLNGQLVVPNIIHPHGNESKRDRKRRETVNKVELLHEESWRTRDEKFQALYKEYHLENKAVNSQPPTAPRYLLRLYPATIERDALLESAEVEYQYKAQQAKRMYESERESIEGQYWDARDQVRQRLLSSIEERRRKLREEKEGGDIVSESLLEAQIKPRPNRRRPFRHRLDSSSRSDTPTNPSHAHPHARQTASSSSNSNSTHPKPDLMLHDLLAPALAAITTDDILAPQSSSLSIIPPVNPTVTLPPGKRGPRQKENPGENKELPAAPGTLTALAIASGQQAPAAPKGTRGAGATGQWVLGKSLAELKRMEQASQLEIDSDWARMQGSTGRGRRARGD